LPKIESEFRELVRRRKVGAKSGNGGLNDVNSLAQSISGPVVLEIEKLIVQLQAVRDHLVNEGQRVQRAITEYAQMSQAATKSTKIITESLAKWAAENRRTDRTSAAKSRRSEPPADGGQPPS
jgi:PleD family two-component response regulator